MTAPSDTPLLSKAQILLDLAASCERESPSREIDCHIAFFVTGDLQVGVKGPLRAPLPYMLSEAVERPRDLQLLANDDNIDMIPRYTTSLDAAVTLVPPKCWRETNGPRPYLNIPSPSPNYWHCEVITVWEPKMSDHHGWGATEALSICAAALRARAATQAPEEGE